MANLEYFLIDPESRQPVGPFDRLSMIRRIKRCSLKREDLVQVGFGEEPQPADRFPELHEIFEEEENAFASPQTPEIRHVESFSGALRAGWETFKLNQALAVLTGIFIIFAVAGLIVFSVTLNGAAFGAAIAIWLQVTLTFYLAAMLRKSRMQLLQGSYFSRLFKKNALKILLGAVLIVFIPGIVPALLWPTLHALTLFLVGIPGTLILTWFLFMPLVMIDREVGLREAFRINNRKMRQGGVDAFTVMYGLLVVNIIVPFLPVTMPITFTALCDVYDRLFNE